MFIATGCSGGGENPLIPATDNGMTSQSTPAGQSYTRLWGYYDVFVDFENETVDVIPNRSIDFMVNVVKLLNNDPTGIQFSFNGTTPGTDYLDVDLDVTIKHPLDDPGYNGYDVRGIFIGERSITLDYNIDLKYSAHGTDQILLNADGYSRWFNPSEFPGTTIWSYVPGNYASPGYNGSATLNPYKYFGEGLGATDDLWSYMTSGAPDVGCFRAESSNTRNYLIRFNNPGQGIKFSYAVTADWSGKDPLLHPSNAPEAVACSVIDYSDVYYIDPSNKGGNLILNVSVFDWDAELTSVVMEDYNIFVESSVLSWVNTLTMSDMTPIGGGEHYSTYHVEIPVDNINGVEEQEFWVIVEDSSADYTNWFGVENDAGTDLIAACFRFDLEVETQSPPWIEVVKPNGGENWGTGTSEEITWISNSVIGTVFIEYSRDYFVSDVNTIAVDEADDGSFMWENIPFDLSDTVQVRISTTDDPGIFDISDADFAIVQPLIEVLVPNGGEEWGAGAYDEITWSSEYVNGTVFIEYSKDNFVSDINTIATDENNDGSYTWDPIPTDFSDTVRVRVSSTDYPGVNDVSDADFSIVEAGWARTWGGTSHDSGYGVAADNTGNIYIAGYFKGTVDFDPGGGDPHTSNGGNDVFLSKFDSYGAFQWVRTWGGLDDDRGWGIATDGSGNVYVTGNFRDTVDFNPDGGDPHISKGDYDNFLSKFDSSGNFEWARIWGGSVYESALGVAADGSGNVYVTGYFRGTSDFDPDSGDPHSSNGYEDAFLSKFDSSGNFEWARTWGGSIYDTGLGVATDGSGNVYVTGLFYGSVDFDPDGVDQHSSNGDQDAFLSKFNSSGDFQLARTWGGDGEDQGRAVAVEVSGNVYVTGIFTDDVEFDPDGGDLHTSEGMEDVFLSRFDSSGNFEWARTWGGSDADEGYGVAVDGSGYVFITGYFRDLVDFDPDGGDLHTSNGWDDIFLSRFDSSGNFEWARTWGAADVDRGYGVTADGLGNVYVTGYFNTPVDFAPSGPPCNENPDVHTSNGYYDAFLTKHLLPDGCW